MTATLSLACAVIVILFLRNDAPFAGAVIEIVGA
jgi:hypothetical protein